MPYDPAPPYGMAVHMAQHHTEHKRLPEDQQAQDPNHKKKTQRGAVQTLSEAFSSLSWAT